VPIVRIPIGRRVFAPSWIWTALTIALCCAFVSLGRWQWHRGEQREMQILAFSRGTDQALPLGSRALAEVPRFQRVSAVGQLDTQRQFLLDNMSHDGQAGYQVLTPFALTDGRVVLVNRGWIPFSGFRDRLPDIQFTAPGSITVVGRVDELPSAGLAQGKMPPPTDGAWPKVTSFPAAEELGRALGHPVEPRIVLLDPKEPNGYVRAWHPPGLEPERHWSYAVQWWAFAGVLLMIWAVMSARRS
jgi:surfeit locus 1 family protein